MNSLKMKHKGKDGVKKTRSKGCKMHLRNSKKKKRKGKEDNTEEIF